MESFRLRLNTTEPGNDITKVLKTVLTAICEERFKQLRLLSYTFATAPAVLLDLPLLSAHEWKRLIHLVRDNHFNYVSRHWIRVVLRVAMANGWLAGTSGFLEHEPYLRTFMSQMIYIPRNRSLAKDDDPFGVLWIYLSLLRKSDLEYSYGDINLMIQKEKPLRFLDCFLTLNEIQNWVKRDESPRLNPKKNDERGSQEAGVSTQNAPLRNPLSLRRARLPVFLEFRDEGVHTTEKTLPPLEPMITPNGVGSGEDWPLVTAVESLFLDQPRIRFAWE